MNNYGPVFFFFLLFLVNVHKTTSLSICFSIYIFLSIVYYSLIILIYYFSSTIHLLVFLCVCRLSGWWWRVRRGWRVVIGLPSVGVSGWEASRQRHLANLWVLLIRPSIHRLSPPPSLSITTLSPCLFHPPFSFFLNPQSSSIFILSPSIFTQLSFPPFLSTTSFYSILAT